MADKVRALKRQIDDLREPLYCLRQVIEGQVVYDYRLASPSGETTLGETFGDHDRGVRVNDRGESCDDCSLWSDRLSAFTRQMSQQAAYAAVTPGAPALQAAVAERRGWTIPMVCDQDGRFSRDMGTLRGETENRPGVSGLMNCDVQIMRTGLALFGPGDEFCQIWHHLDLVGGPQVWELAA